MSRDQFTDGWLHKDIADFGKDQENRNAPRCISCESGEQQKPNAQQDD
jgi:hypothetical protein